MYIKNFKFNNKGLVLIVVLWVTLLVSLLLSGIILHASSEIKQTLHSKDKLYGNIAISNSIELLKQKIAIKEINSISDIKNIHFSVNEYDVNVTKVVDESNKIDINTFPLENIYSSLLSIGISKKESETISAQIIDWRDEDSIVSKHGAEKNDYLRLNIPPPANRDFYSTMELLKIPAIKRNDISIDLFTVTGRGHNIDLVNQSYEMLESSNNITGKIYTLELTAKRKEIIACRKKYTILITGLSDHPIEILQQTSM